MVQDVYIDILFLINFSMDYICIFICSKVLHRKAYPLRMILAAAIGGVWSVISLFLPMHSYFEIISDCAVGFLMCAVSYYERGRGFASLLSTSLLFIGVSMMMGGCMTAVFNLLNKLDLPLDTISSDGISTYLFAFLAAVAGIISLKSGQLISHRASVTECRLKVKFCGYELQFKGLSDSGNLVREPISGKAVIFIERSVMESSISLDFIDEFLKGKLDPSAPCKDLRLISLRTAVGASIAVAAMPDTVQIEFENSKGKTVLITVDALIAPTNIGNSAQGYSAIVPAEIIKE